MKDNTTLIFDLDGTIVDSLGLAVKTFNDMAKLYRFNKIDESEIEGFRDMHLLDIARVHGLFKYGPLAPFIIWDFKRRESKEMIYLHTFPGMQKVLSELKEKKITLGVLTSNSKKNAETFLESHDLLECFDFVKSEFSGFGKHKALEKIVHEYKLDPEKTLYVGDEVRDIEASKKANLPIISVSWGYNSVELLAKSNPDFLATRPEEILSLLSIFNRSLPR